MVSRAVYLVLVNDLTSITFFAALQELMCRRGKPKIMLSDKGPHFVHTSKMLKEIKEAKETKSKLAQIGIEWRFTPAYAPWCGGIYECLIGVMKKKLSKLLV